MLKTPGEDHNLVQCRMIAINIGSLYGGGAVDLRQLTPILTRL